MNNETRELELEVELLNEEAPKEDERLTVEEPTEIRAGVNQSW